MQGTTWRESGNAGNHMETGSVSSFLSLAKMQTRFLTVEKVRSERKAGHVIASPSCGEPIDAVAHLHDGLRSQQAGYRATPPLISAHHVRQVDRSCGNDCNDRHTHGNDCNPAAPTHTYPVPSPHTNPETTHPNTAMHACTGAFRSRPGSRLRSYHGCDHGYHRGCDHGYHRGCDHGSILYTPDSLHACRRGRSGRQPTVRGAPVIGPGSRPGPVTWSQITALSRD